jgi:4-alpha-glucanotransferase
MLHTRESGILLHPTCLPGPHGLGDLGPAAYHFVDWLASAGQSLWQTLPLTPIGPGNSPYASISAFAGSPLLVALEPLIERGWMAAVDETTLGLFDRQEVQFGSVVPWRMARLREAAAGFASRASSADRAALDAYVRCQASWLDDFALFMALEAHHQDKAGASDWPGWDPRLARREPAALHAARQDHADEIHFWQFVQWCFDTQWTALRTYAADRGIRMVGDLPIFIAHHSADCWARPDLYWLDDALRPTVVAGVPPDFFSTTGQHWGNPLYRWDALAKEGYGWWVERMRRQLALCDLVRVDHFRGFAGYWEIPASAPNAASGQWVPGPGLPLFRALEAALGPLPIIAEDLGVITDDVVALRDALGAPGMRILEFAFGDGAENAYLPHNYIANTVVYSGTHDNDTARGWWQSCSAGERAFAQRYLATDGSDIHWQLIRAASASVARTAIFPLQDVLGLDGSHRLNTPGTTECWTWRFQWDWVGPDVAPRLRELSRTFGRVPPGSPAQLDRD